MNKVRKLIGTGRKSIVKQADTAQKKNMAIRSRMIIGKILLVLRVIFDYSSRFIFGLIYRNKSDCLPPIEDLTLLESATSLAEKIRKGKIRSEDVVKAFIQRIKQVNPIINAVVDQRFEEAIREAQNVDNLIATGQKTEEEIAKDKPFLGVPFTTKECFSVKGLHQSAGLVARKNIIADETAPALVLMQKAGAILIAVTNVSELCMWWESNNNVYGRSRNPYVTTRIVGGSSGGEGANLAAAGSVIGVGSDIGGSIRIPSFFNGIFGHKPSAGLVPIDGQVPPCHGELRNYLTVGPMCRYATDLLPMFKILSQENSSKLKLDQKVELRKLKIYYMEDDGGFPLVSPVHPELKGAMRKVIYHFEKAHGVKAEKLKIRELFYSLAIWGSKMGAGSSISFAEHLGDGKGAINVGLECLKWSLFSSNYTLPALLLCLFEAIGDRSSEYLHHMNGKFTSLRDQLQTLLGDNGVLFYPSNANPAPYHNQPIFQPFNFAYTAIFNVLGLPSTQCPLGLGSDGVPLGVQAVGNLYNDHIPLAVAVELEKAFGGWVPPCPTP